MYTEPSPQAQKQSHASPQQQSLQFHDALLASNADNSLRESFIIAANSLTNMYKRSVLNEKLAREAGRKDSILTILEWTRKNSTGRQENFVPVDQLESFCYKLLENAQTSTQTQTLTPAQPSSCPHIQPPLIEMEKEKASRLDVEDHSSESSGKLTPVTRIGELQSPRTMAITSDLDSLAVGRKRPRIDNYDDLLYSEFGDDEQLDSNFHRSWRHFMKSKDVKRVASGNDNKSNTT